MIFREINLSMSIKIKMVSLCEIWCFSVKCVCCVCGKTKTQILYDELHYFFKIKGETLLNNQLEKLKE